MSIIYYSLRYVHSLQEIGSLVIMYKVHIEELQKYMGW